MLHRSNISQLIINSGGRILDEISDIENLYGVAARDSEPTVIAIGHPTRFRRVKYLMALAKGDYAVVD